VTAAAFLFVVPALRSTPARDISRMPVIAVVFTAAAGNGSATLWVRPLASLEAHVLAGTDNGHLPFWSPDSRQIAFFADGTLKRIPAAGGTVETLCDAKDSRGGSWGSQGVIVFAPENAGARRHRGGADAGFLAHAGHRTGQQEWRVDPHGRLQLARRHRQIVEARISRIGQR